MKLRYFVVDDQGQLCRASRAAVEEVWAGHRRASHLGCSSRTELRLVSVICNSDLLPKKVFVLRLPLTGGHFTEENYLTLQLFTRPDCVTRQEVIQHHTQGWPSNFFSQLAVALDVPREALDVPLGVGGPLFMAAALQMTPQQALRYLR